MKSLLLAQLFLVVLLLAACRPTHDNLPDEDYKKLFPVTGKIDKPEVFFGDMIPQPCDPTQAELSEYAGVDIEEDVKSYTVTFTYGFSEYPYTSIEHEVQRANFVIRYLNENGKLVSLSSYASNKIKPDIFWNERYEVSFKAKSGFPLYLAVYGAGYGFFRLNISMQARSEDGLIITPELKYNKRYFNEADMPIEPYCQKIILP